MNYFLVLYYFSSYLKAMDKSLPIYKSLFFLGLPIVGGNIAQFSSSVVDTAMLGHYDPKTLASLIVASSVFFILLIVGGGFSFALVPVVAAHDARDEDTLVRRNTRMAIWLSIIFSTLVFPILYWSDSVLMFLGQSEELSQSAHEYLRIMAFVMFPALLDVTLRCYLTGLKHTNIVLWATVSGLICKTIIGWLFVFGKFGCPELGIEGAALSTLAGTLVILIFFVWHAQRYFPQHELFKNIWKPDVAALRRIFTLGLPIGLTYLAESGLFSGVTIMVGWIGEIEVASHGIAMQIMAITFMVHLGISQIATTLIGNAYGREDSLEVLRRIGICAISMSSAFAFIIIVVFLSVPESLLSLFIDNSNPDSVAILSIGVSLMIIAACFQLTDGLQAVGLGLLRGMQDVKVPFIIALVSYWGVGFTTSYLLGIKFSYGPQGVWLGLVTGLAIASVLLLTRFWHKTRN
tara:strand:- start:440 stop:1825 length:1386 start_codon:yes stop_codon:yes gene_type:complete